MQNHTSKDFITITQVVSSNAADCDKVGEFLRVLWFPPPIKLTIKI